jgi:hypothetical protein
MANLPTGYQPGNPYTAWDTSQIVALVQAVINSSASNAINGTVGATTPSTGVFTTLTNNGVQADGSVVVAVPVTSFATTIPNATSRYLMTPAGTLAAGTLTMPAAPVNNQELIIMTSQTISSFTLSANVSQTISNAPTTLTANTAVVYFFHGTNWYREQ